MISTNSKTKKALDRLGVHNASARRAIVEAGTVITVPAQWAPITQGTGADKAYLILEGEAEVRRSGTAVARIGVGDVMGETGIEQRRLRNATVVALTPLCVLHFSRPAWARLIKQVPELPAALHRLASERETINA